MRKSDNIQNNIVIILSLLILIAASTHSSAFPFTAPYDADLFLKPLGGSAEATTEFGIGNSVNNHTPYFTNLPNNPTPDQEIEIGMFSAGTDINFYLRTLWQGTTYWAFSDAIDQGSLIAFTDIDNSLGYGGSVIEQINNNTWLLHLDDAASLCCDDDDNDVLIQLRLSATTTPVPEPGILILLGTGLACLIWLRRRDKTRGNKGSMVLFNTQPRPQAAC